jgi:hypothetical protein
VLAAGVTPLFLMGSWVAWAVGREHRDERIHPVSSELVGTWVNEYETRLELRADRSFGVTRIRWRDGHSPDPDRESGGDGWWELTAQWSVGDYPWAGVDLHFDDGVQRPITFLQTDKDDEDAPVELWIEDGDPDDPEVTEFRRE